MKGCRKGIEAGLATIFCMHYISLAAFAYLSYWAYHAIAQYLFHKKHHPYDALKFRHWADILFPPPVGYRIYCKAKKKEENIKKAKQQKSRIKHAQVLRLKSALLDLIVQKLQLLLPAAKLPQRKKNKKSPRNKR